MKLLFVNDIDLPGARFNGYDLQVELNRRNILAKQMVVERQGKDPNTVPLVSDRTRYFESYIRDLERELSLNGLAGVYGRILMDRQEFLDADIVHYHLIHNSLISLLDLPKMMSIKPSVWTLHDPWALTGHCIHPIRCDRWRSGCKVCPYLDRIFALKKDNSGAIWKIKKAVYAQLLNVDIVVASKWMQTMVAESPLTMNFKRVHLIPFGIDLSIFSPKKNKQAIREKYGVLQDAFVIFFRAEESEFKGLQYIKKMLDVLDVSNNVVLLTVGQKGLLNEFKYKYTVKDHGWLNDPNDLAELYCAADIFLMPSIAEAFGLMAVEAMASGVPVIVFEGTALPSVTFAPNCGILLKPEDTLQFAETIKRLMNDRTEIEYRGKLGVELANQYYNIEQYNSNMYDLYKEIYQRTREA